MMKHLLEYLGRTAAFLVVTCFATLVFILPVIGNLAVVIVGLILVEQFYVLKHDEVPYVSIGAAILAFVIHLGAQVTIYNYMGWIK